MRSVLPKDFVCPLELRGNIQKKIKALKETEDVLSVVYIVHDLKEMRVVYMSQRGLDYLGKTLEEVREAGKDYFSEFFNPEDLSFYLPKFLEHVSDDQKNEKWFSYYQQVKNNNSESYNWYLSVSSVFFKDLEGKPLLSLTVAIQLDHDHHITQKVERLMEENRMLKSLNEIYKSLTRKELEIIAYMAKGMNAQEISECAFISVKTAQTHRKNIKRKIGAKSNYDVTRFAQAFNIV